MLWPITVARLSHTVCCLWLQQLRFISFCLLQHNCCQYSCEIFQENEQQQKWFFPSFPSSLSSFLTHIFSTCVCTVCVCIWFLVILKFDLFCHEDQVMMEFYQLLSHMTSFTNTRYTYSIQCTPAVQNLFSPPNGSFSSCVPRRCVNSFPLKTVFVQKNRI